MCAILKNYRGAAIGLHASRGTSTSLYIVRSAPARVSIGVGAHRVRE